MSFEPTSHTDSKSKNHFIVDCVLHYLSAIHCTEVTYSESSIKPPRAYQISDLLEGGLIEMGAY